LGAALSGAAGCGTTRVTSTQRTATEQLLVSNAIDQSVSQLDFRLLAGKPVYFDAQYLAPGADHGYVVSSLRQHLLACGCLLQEDRARATYVVEARSGGLGTDLHEVLLGVPQMNVPSLVPGQPSLIPEIPLAKKTDQKGVAKIAVFAYNRRSGQPVWQSGVVQSDSTSKDTWVLGAGPFRRGTLGEATEIAGQQVAIPLLSGRQEGKEGEAPVLPVTRPAAWTEPVAEPEPFPLAGEPAAPAAQPPKTPAAPGPAAPASTSVESASAGRPGLAGGTPAALSAAVAPAFPAPGRPGAGNAPGQPQAKDSGARKAAGSQPAGDEPPK
jgi:hypothetical protein